MNPYFLFQIESYRFLIETHNLVEILTTYEIHAIPRAPPHILGLTSIRSSIVVILDMRHLLSLQHPAAQHARLVIVEHNNENFGILVDFIDAAQSLSEADPPTAHPLKSHIRDSFLHQDQVAHVLNIATLLRNHEK